MNFITDHNVPDPVVQSLLAVRFDVRRVVELTPQIDDRYVMQACLDTGGILITRDRGIPSQAYLNGFGQRGLTVVLLRWKDDEYREWQEMVETILRDAGRWASIASTNASIISASYSSSRSQPWKVLAALKRLADIAEEGT